MNKAPFYLAPIKRGRNFQFGTWDCESHVKGHSLKCHCDQCWFDLIRIGFFDGKRFQHTPTVRRFLEIILTRKYNGWRFFAHYGGKYDCNFIFNYLVRENPALLDKIDMNFIVAGSCVIAMSLTYGKTTVKLCDSFRLLKASLDDLTIKFGVRHKKLPFDPWSIPYLKNDCLGLYEVLTIFFDETNLRSPTIATQAMQLFRRDFLKQKLYVPHRKIEDFVRESFHGGRVEIFKRQGNVKAFDVNSMYPWAMTLPVPTGYYCRTKSIDHDRSKYVAFLRARITVPDCYIPPLPTVQGKLIFPTGFIEGVYTDYELEQVLKIPGNEVKILEGALFFASPLLKEYAETIYALKKNSDEPKRTIYKYLLNTLFGKFGQGRLKKVYKIYRGQQGVYPIVDKETGEPTLICYYEKESNSAHILPHISAAITARARVKMHNLLLSCNPYYADTDSVFTSDSLPISPELGELDKQGEGYLTCYQPKLYNFAGKWKSKGISAKNTELIKAFTNGEEVKQSRNRSILVAANKNETALFREHLTKQMKNTFPKRVWCGDDTRPWKRNREGALT
jgi:hypothetical protein